MSVESHFFSPTIDHGSKGYSEEMWKSLTGFEQLISVHWGYQSGFKKHIGPHAFSPQASTRGLKMCPPKTTYIPV